LNILILIRFFSPEVGGSEFLFCTIAELLAKNGHNVWVITNKLEGVNYIQHPNIKTIFVSSHPLSDLKKWKQQYKINFIFSSLSKGMKIIKNEKIDIIHSNLFEPTIASSILSSLTSKPHILTIHDITPIKKEFLEGWNKQKKNSRLKSFFGTSINKTILRLKHDAIHTVSRKTKEDLENFYKNKPIHVIANSIPLKNEEKIATIPFQFVYIGRLVFHKNIPLVLRAIKKVMSRYPKVTLIIAGDGDYRKKLEKIVAELAIQQNVIFKGHVTEEEKQRLLASSQALVFPSLFEGFGLVILEAFMQKTPALVSDVRPLSDIVEHKETGLVIPAHDENEWANAMENLIQDPKLALKMGEAGRKVLEERYSLEIFYNKILAMYEKVLKN